MNIHDPTEDDIASYNEWGASRPPAVQELAKRFLPWKLYKLKSSGHRVTIYSIGEPIEAGKTLTFTVNVLGKYNRVAFERRVFGIPPDDLEECDLPGPDEVLGSDDMTIEEVQERLKRRLEVN
jgi:hypothetical protein